MHYQRQEIIWVKQTFFFSSSADLVPIYSFGENELFDQVKNPRGTWLRYIQERLQQIMGISLPLFHARGVFQYSFGLMPYRKPINTVGKRSQMLVKYHWCQVKVSWVVAFPKLRRLRSDSNISLILVSTAFQKFLLKFLSRKSRLKWINYIEANQREEKKEISLTFQIFLLDRNEVNLILNGNFWSSLLLLKVVSWLRQKVQRSHNGLL